MIAQKSWANIFFGIPNDIYHQKYLPLLIRFKISLRFVQAIFTGMRWQPMFVKKKNDNVTKCLSKTFTSRNIIEQNIGTAQNRFRNPVNGEPSPVLWWGSFFSGLGGPVAQLPSWASCCAWRSDYNVLTFEYVVYADSWNTNSRVRTRGRTKTFGYNVDALHNP